MQVSTYRLDVEDIIEVLQDIVVVQEDAASRKQRLTKVYICLVMACLGIFITFQMDD
jgi:hypothetical protein